MDYVGLELFMWAFGAILTLTGIAIKYMYDRVMEIKSMVEDNKKERVCQMEGLDKRLDIIEDCHTETQVNIAKINKDIEYIRLRLEEFLDSKK